MVIMQRVLLGSLMVHGTPSWIRFRKRGLTDPRAALKQVPSCEFFPMEALRTNTVGAANVMDGAVDAGVKKVIVLSTDKAVYPINAMGLSKAMMEKVMVAKARPAGESGTVLCGTRYGNVMASRGSVIPLFIGLIQAGQPLTVTDPEMTRFMMSIDDAIDLVLYAFEHGKPGDMFVQKSPAATIETLALALKKIFKSGSPLKVMGTRHGEKRHETLLTREEMAKAEDLGGYYRIPADARGLNYNLYFSEGEKKIALLDDYNSSNTRRLDVDGMAELLLTLDIVQDELQGRKK
jgi:UDP-glucose 4-epimerase